MPVHAALIEDGKRTAGRSVVAANGEQPIPAQIVMFAQDVSGNREIAVRVQQLAGLADTVSLVADVELAEAGVDTSRWHLVQCATQSATSLVARGVAVRSSGNVQGPRPGNQTPPQKATTPPQRHPEHHRARDPAPLSRSLPATRR